MMNNMFSIFDPSTSMFLPLNWLSMLIIFMLLPMPMWMCPSRLSMLWSTMINFMLNELKSLMNHTSYANSILFIALFLFIMMNNFMGLFPYIFTASSHLSFPLSLSMSIWFGMTIFSIFNYLNDMCTHMTPQGTPFIIMPFMVMIESISLLIRPLTLAVRLTANMIAGHLLLSLLGSSGTDTPIMFLPIMLISQILLFILEIAVSIIQAYVFSILSTLYSNEYGN